MIRPSQCQCCGGSGVCPRCGGWGSRWSIVRIRAHREPCPHCSGVGSCGACAGRGRYPGGGALCGLLRLWWPVRRLSR